jgi:hypothetical protein
MSDIVKPDAVDAAEARPDRSQFPATAPYAAPRLLEIGSTTRMIRGGGGGSGQDCRYYYYYSSGPYGC